MPFYNNARNLWIGQIRYQGKRYQKAFSKKSDAKKWEVFAKENLEKEVLEISLGEWISQYLEFSQERYVRKTYLEKRFAFKELLKSIPSERSVASLHKGEILRHLRKQNKSRGGNATNNDRKNFIAGWNWGLKYLEGFPYNENPFLVDRFPEKRYPRYVPPKSDFYKVLDVAESKQDKLLLLCYLHLGARRSELFNLKWDDISFSGQKVRLKTRKRQDGNEEYDWLPLTKTISIALASHRLGHRSELVFPNPKTGAAYTERLRWMNRLCDRAGVKRFGLHAIRHLTASILIENDTPLIDIQTVLRHKSISTTEKYLHRLRPVRGALSVFDNEPYKKPYV